MDFMEVMRSNDLIKLKVYLQFHDVNEEVQGQSLLSWSCYFGLVETSRYLLESGAVIDEMCMDQAYYGFQGHVQSDTLKLLGEYGWINLYLDDLRDIPEGFIGARTVEEAISIMEQNTVHMLSLDHDLGMDEEGNLLKTGYDLVKYICEKGLRVAKVYIHSDNAVGRENMYKTLLAARKRKYIDENIEIYRYSITVNRYSGK